MNVETLTKKIKSIYSDFINVDSNYMSRVNDVAIDMLESSIINAKIAIKSNDTSMELVNLFKATIETNQKALKLAKNNKEKSNVSMVDHEIAIRNATSDYQKAVSVFTKAGGRGFYDLAVTVVPESLYKSKDKNQISEVEGVAKSMQKSGLDIKVFQKVGDKKITLLMPSSIINEFKHALEEKSPRYIPNSENYRQNLISTTSHFILPAINSDLSIEQAMDELSKTEGSSRDTVSCYTSMGYLRTELSEDLFSNGNRDPLNDSIVLAISSMTGYIEPGFHVNGSMPTQYTLSDKAKIKLGINNRSEIRYNVVHDLKLSEIANKNNELSV